MRPSLFTEYLIIMCPEWLTSLTPSLRMCDVCVCIAHTILNPHRMGEICAQTKHLSTEPTYRSEHLKQQRQQHRLSRRTHGHKYNGLTTFSFCKLCGTVSGNLFIFLFFDDVVVVGCFSLFSFHSYRPFMCVILN